MSQSSVASGTLERYGHINALLVALSSLLRASSSWNSAALPHVAAKPSCTAPSSVGLDVSTPPRLPQRRLLDTIAALCAFHPSCGGVAVSLEAAPDRVVLYIAPDQVPSAEVRDDVQSWMELARCVAQTQRDGEDAGVAVIAQPETRLMASIYRACYSKVRTHVREGNRLLSLLEKLKESVDDEDAVLVFVKDVDGQLDTEPEEEGMEKFCMDLDLFISCLEPESAGDPDDDTRMAAICLAGWFAVSLLRTKQFRRDLERVDKGAVKIIEDACALSTLANSLVNSMKATIATSALSVPWMIEWVDPPPTSSSPPFEAMLSRPLIDEWLVGIHDWKTSHLVSNPPDVELWPWSEAVKPLLDDVPSDLTKDGTISSTDSATYHASSTSELRHTHCEATLLKHVLETSQAVYPYIATTQMPCYACVMLVRVVNTISGCGHAFVLRGCDGQVSLPWSLPSIAHPAGFMTASIGEHFERVLLEDLRTLVWKGAELLAIREEVVLLECDLEEMAEARTRKARGVARANMRAKEKAREKARETTRHLGKE